MNETCESCPHERVRQAEHRLLSESLKELKDRVRRVETTLARGVLLLVANLAGIVMSLTHEFLQR